MRSDISRVIIGRPRTHSECRDEGRKGRHREDRLATDAASKESMSANRFNRDKSPTDVLAPLVGYLRKNVGKHWDKVHKDISSHLKVTSMAQSHVLDHLDSMVVKKVVMKLKGNKYKPYTTDGLPVSVGDDNRTYQGFFVDPRTGILRLAPIDGRYNRFGRTVGMTAAKLAVKTIKLGKFTYKKVDDIWYEITLVELPPAVTTYQGYTPSRYKSLFGHYPPMAKNYQLDVLYGANAYDLNLVDRYGRKVYCTAKKLIPLKKAYSLGLEEKPSAKPNIVRKK